MGKSSGGVRVRSKTGGIGRDGGGAYRGMIENVGSLKEIKDGKLRRSIQQGISKYEARMGVKTDVKLADLNGAYGVHATAGDGSKSMGVYLNRGTFKDGTIESIDKIKQYAYKVKFLNKTNKTSQHTVVHELAHATWNNHYVTPKHLAAGKEMEKLYNTFKKENPRKWGSYSKTNINEFYAEGISKHVLGGADKYTSAMARISRKYRLNK